jgi:asparagine synthase (glutamine-hydrolysing)
MTFGGDAGFAARPEPAVFGRRSVLHRGFIANRVQLAAEARRRGHAGTELADADLFALAYEWWGAELSRHVLGEYAVAICDAERQQIVLAHDELGLMPMFYAATERAISFASHLDDLVKETGVGDIDEEYIADWFARAEHFGDRTPYAHIQRLLPGQSLIWGRGRASRHDVWTLAKVAPRIYRDPREYDAELREVITEAVASATPASGTVWCELSGGLDSSTVLAVASRLGTSVEAVSFIYSQSYASDERNFIDAVLRRYPVPWHPLDIDSAQPFTELPRRFVAEPSVWVVNDAFDRIYVELLERHGVDVVLTGEGGDSVLFGDVQQPYYLADSLRHGRLRRLWTDACRWAEASDGKRSPTYVLLACAVEPSVRYLRSETLEYRTMPIPWVSQRFADRMHFARRRRAPWLPPSESVGNSYVLQRIMRSANLIATHMQHRHVACEFRSPLLYRPLVEFMLAVPWEHKLGPRGDRLLQRRAFEGVLPDETLRRTNKGGSDQPWYAGLDSSPLWRKALTAQPRIVDRGWVRLDEWRATVQRARVGRTIGIGHFRASAAIELWLQQLERTPAAGDHAVADAVEALR